MVENTDESFVSIIPNDFTLNLYRAISLSQAKPSQNHTSYALVDQLDNDFINYDYLKENANNINFKRGSKLEKIDRNIK